jgi:hypothetical protein
MARARAASASTASRSRCAGATTRIVGIEADRTCTVWTLDGTVRERFVLGDPARPLRWASFDARGSQALLIDKTISDWQVIGTDHWDLQTKTLVRTYEPPYNEGYADARAALSPDGGFVAIGFDTFSYPGGDYSSCGSSGIGLRVISIAGDVVHECPFGSIHDDVLAVAVAREARVFALHATNGYSEILRRREPEPVSYRVGWSNPNAIAVAPSGSLCAAFEGSELRVHQLSEQPGDEHEPPCATLPVRDALIALAFSDDDAVLWTFTESGRLTPLSVSSLSFA